MMTKHEEEFVSEMKKLNCGGFAARLEDVFSTSHVTDKELLDVLTDKAEQEVLEQKQKKGLITLKKAGLLNTYANLDMIEFTPGRNIDRTLIERLSTCFYIDEAANVLITGAAGTGKTFLAKAFAVKACEEGYRSRICNTRLLLKELATLYRNNEDDKPYRKKMKYYSNIPLLVLDEWLEESPSSTEALILKELVDTRWDRHSTIVCSQVAMDNWVSIFKNTAHGQAIVGRLKAHRYSIELTGDDMRMAHTERP